MEQQAVHNGLERCVGYSNFIAKAFCQGGNVMWVIAFIGLCTAFLIVNRLVALNRLTVDKTNITENLFTMILRGDIRQAIAFCDSRPTPLTNTLKDDFQKKDAMIDPKTVGLPPVPEPPKTPPHDSGDGKV